MWAWRSADRITDEALGLLPRLSADGRPFLLFLNYMDVHRPIHPPERYRTRYPGRLPGFDMMADWSALHRGPERGGRVPTEAERTHLASQYDGALAFLDEHVGRLLDALDAEGLLDPSLVLVLSDHGESFGSHGTFGHGSSVYQDVAHVPLVLTLPGQTEGRRVDTPVGLADVLPTVTSVLGLPAPGPIDGRSLLDRPRVDRPLPVESYGQDGLQMRALVHRNDKIVVRPERPAELYALDRDPDESADRATDEPERTAELQRMLERTLRGGANEGRDALSEEEAARLRALGYLE